MFIELNITNTNIPAVVLNSQKFSTESGLYPEYCTNVLLSV